MICCLVADAARPGVLEAIARSCSPRVTPYGDAAVIFDASGLTGLFGTPAELAREVQSLAAGQQVTVRVALAGTITAAWILAHARAGVSVVPPGGDAAALAPIPIGRLDVLPEMAMTPEAPRCRRSRVRHYRMAPGPNAGPAAGGSDPAASESPVRVVHAETPTPKAVVRIIERWGIGTLGAFARLPRAEVHARLGPLGVRLHQAASGEDRAPLAPAAAPAGWVERFECEWPIEGLEPLSFVLARVCEALALRLERADRGAVEVTTRLELVTRAVHVRTLHLPSPMRDARGLRTLVLLDLESHPPGAGIDAVTMELGVAPGAILTGSLLARAVPAPDDLATLTARLGALLGSTRVGAPALVDTHDDRQINQRPFTPPAEPKNQAPKNQEPKNQEPGTRNQEPRSLSLRRFRLPIAARVEAVHHVPVRVTPCARGLAGGRVVACAGPWRSSGEWWSLDRAGWDRDVWDVELTDGGVYRLARDRTTDTWVLDAVMD